MSKPSKVPSSETLAAPPKSKEELRLKAVEAEIEKFKTIAKAVQAEGHGSKYYYSPVP